MMTMQNTMGLITATARTCGVGADFPKQHTGHIGDVLLWASHVTTGSGADLLRCLAALGLSRGEWRQIDDGRRRAVLSDLDGEIRGEVLMTADGASARLCYALTRPLACMA